MRCFSTALNRAKSNKISTPNTRYLFKYDPDYTKSHLANLKTLADQGTQFCGWEKSDALDSAIKFSTLKRIDIIPNTFKMLQNAGPDLIPASALLQAIRAQKRFQNDALVVRIWKYLCENYTDNFTAILMELVRYFGPKHKYQWLVEEALVNLDPQLLSDPLVVGDIMIWCNHQGLYRRSLDYASNCPVNGKVLAAKIVALTALQDSRANDLAQAIPKFSGFELAALVKVKAMHSLAEAVQFVESFDQSVKGLLRLQASHFQLINQAIEASDRTVFDRYMDLVGRNPKKSLGMLLNMRVKWEYKHGTFGKARLHFQHALTGKRVHRKHLVVAFNCLKDFDKKLGANAERKQWLEATEKSIKPFF